MHKILLLFVLIVALLAPSSGKVSVGSVHSYDDFVFVDSFCYEQSGGHMVLEVEWPQILKDDQRVDDPSQKVLIYSDLPSQWPTLNEDMDCDSKVDQAGYVMGTDSLPSRISIDMNVVGLRPRFWYLAFSRCGSDDGVNVPHYNFTFVNGEGTFVREFSYDEQGILESEIGFFLGFLILFCVSVFQLDTFSTQKIEASAIKVITVVISLHVVGLIFTLVDRSVFSVNGVGIPKLGFIFPIIEVLTFIILTGAFLLLAQGWTLIHSFKDTPARIATLLYVGILTLSHIATYVYYYGFINDPFELTKTFLYTTPPGLATVALHLLAMVWFVEAVVVSLINLRREETPSAEKEERKKTFLCLGLFGAFWLACVVFTFVIGGLSEPWLRQKSFVISELGVSFFGVVILLCTLRVKVGQLFSKMNEKDKDSENVTPDGDEMKIPQP
eukprot:TRINITY_DN1986_c0_g1_i1.p1 TRINITY_DN1986_c0_g1~~TRINITY_DN1986_c0_g1_i1.p1  ORF type:complete len:441 (+),score=70.55 TRINITY_DN1986_c0_g1_i1:480-1802(+)